MGGSLRQPTKALDDSTEWTELRRRRALHSEIRMVLFDRRHIILQTSRRFDPTADHQVGGVQREVPAADRERNVISLCEGEPGLEHRVPSLVRIRGYRLGHEELHLRMQGAEVRWN